MVHHHLHVDDGRDLLDQAPAEGFGLPELFFDLRALLRQPPEAFLAVPQGLFVAPQPVLAGQHVPKERIEDHRDEPAIEELLRPGGEERAERPRCCGQGSIFTVAYAL